MRLTGLRAAIVSLTIAIAGPALAADWPMFGFGPRHDGYNPNETILSPVTVPTLATKWSFNTSTYRNKQGLPVNNSTKPIIGQPVVASGVNVGGVSKELLYVGVNGGTFLAIDVNNVTRNIPTVQWARNVPAIDDGCVQTSSPSGIKSTAAIDRTANGGKGAVYVAANGLVYAWDLATGSTVPGWPEGGVVIPNLNVPLDGIIFSGVTVSNGKIYVAGASNGCETPPYNGSINVIDAATATVTAQWFTGTGTNVPSTISGGSIWGPGGVSVDENSASPAIFTATGNPRPIGAQYIQRFFLAIVAARPDLSSLDFFWQPNDLGGDTDFGSTPVPINANACPYQIIPVQRKTGAFYVPVISQTTPRQLQAVNIYQIYSGANNLDFQAAAFDPVSQLIMVTTIDDGPAPYVRGVHAFQVNSDCSLTQAWQTNYDISGNPLIAAGQRMSAVTIANGVAYFASGVDFMTPNPAYHIFAVAMQSGNGVGAGQVLWQSSNSTSSYSNGPAVVNGRVYIADNKGIIWAYSPNGL